ncbi:hypothetical protein ACFQER_05900 [Halomicroarcula sp. GCM10025894]|uniref:hypothetical protein n=1 Tax=Halomicroarcula sp. GCM10025894 TaxID=3252673 RepID=UPI00361B2DCA
MVPDAGRAASPEDDGSAVVAHIDITQRKLAELAAERRSEQLKAERSNLQHLVDRVEGSSPPSWTT